MKKNIIYLFIALTLVSLFLTLMPHVSAQTEDTNIKVLNYSYHIEYSQGILVVVGEVQNTGSSTLWLDKVLVSGSVYTADGINHGDSSGRIYAVYLVPQQKMPFEINFNAPKNSPDGTWLSLDISRIDFKITQAAAVSTYPYPDVKIISQSSTIDTTTLASGTYWVSGKVQNTGSQTAQSIFVVATFYNSSGSTVAFGYTDPLNLPSKSLTPSNTTSFKLGAFDLNMSTVTPQQKISSYSLMVRPGNPNLNGAAPPPSAYGIVADSASSLQPDTSSNPTPTGSSTGNSTTPFSYEWLLYAAIIIIVIVAVVITIKTFPKRKSSETKKKSLKAISKKTQGKTRFFPV
jgi:hypothetical protein